MKISKLANSIQKAKIRVMYDIAREMDDVISLTVGEPDFKTPKSIVDVCIDYFNQGLTAYTPNNGLFELRKAVADYYSPITGHSINPDKNVMITVGAQEALVVAMQVLLDPGDDVLLCNPYYVSYLGQIKVCGCNPVFFPIDEENGWIPTLEALEAAVTDKTRVMIVNSPNNPTGSEIDRVGLEMIADFAIRHDIVVISDEPYNKIRYSEEPFVSISSISGMEDRSIVVNSFSKTYAMPGWRLGYAVGPEWIIQQMPKTHDVTVSCVPAPFQYAGAYALKNCDADVEMMVEKFKRRRDLVVEGINSIDGLSCIAPKGTFYLLFNIKELGVTSEEFAFGLLREEHVALVPGSGFGERGEGYVRLTFAKDEESLKEAIDRIRHYVERIRNTGIE